MTPAFFTQQQTAVLDKKLIPKHIAIIPDGNRRWAKQRRSLTEFGHREGANVIIDIVNAAKELGVQTITIYLFSTENWFRPYLEVKALMWLLEEFLNSQRQSMVNSGIRVSTIGHLPSLSKSALECIDKSIQATAHCDKINLVLALNYGSRNEICRAAQKIVRDIEQGKISAEAIDEKVFSSYLDTAQWGDPDLLIRTSGEMRLSNFLLWQASYTEIYVIDILWPDFRPVHLLEAVHNYQMRDRRLGGA